MIVVQWAALRVSVRLHHCVCGQQAQRTTKSRHGAERGHILGPRLVGTLDEDRVGKIL